MALILWKGKIPLTPRTKKNSQQIKWKWGKGKQIPYISQGETYLQYEQDAGYFIKRPQDPFCGPINLRAYFYMDTEGRVDLVNLLQSLSDILVKYHVIKDDDRKIIKGYDGSRVFTDKKNPRTEIYIEEYVES